jgi:hypothetical protein
MHGRRAPARPPRLTGSGRLRSAAGLADRGPADQQHQPAAPRRGGHLARTPNSAASTSRGTYFGGDLIGHSRHADRLMHPSSRGSASAMRTLRPASARTAWACSTPPETTPARRCVSRWYAARNLSSSSSPAGPLPAMAAPRRTAAACTSRTTVRTLPMSWGKRPPCSQAPIVESGWPGAAPEHAGSARQLPEGAIQAGSAPAPAASTVRSLTGPAPLRIPGGLGVDRRSRAVGGWLWVGRVTWTVEGRPELPTVRGTT